MHIYGLCVLISCKATAACLSGGGGGLKRSGVSVCSVPFAGDELIFSSSFVTSVFASHAHTHCMACTCHINRVIRIKLLKDRQGNDATVQLI